ncbi:unnamed protein product [Lymnaea stagnalis]|uniref:Uncharacterized protein n=1 Tax=Lymnaea stagnalis TaxID=6523 RepID=A0AAV2IL87_LYMST
METGRILLLTMTMMVVVESREAPSTKETLKTVYVTKGDTAIFQCGLKASPTQKISWIKNGTNVETLSGRYSINTEFSPKLRIFKAQLSDDGNYSCVVEDELGHYRNTFSLQVSIAPDAKIISPKNGSIHEKSNVSVVCRATAKPPARFEWILGQHHIMTASDTTSLQKERMTARVRQVAPHTYESTFEISLVEYRDFGWLSCAAFNQLSMARDGMLLNITYPPKIVSAHNTSSPVYWWPAHRVNLTCIVDGNSAPVITWSTHPHDEGDDNMRVNCSNIEVDQRENEVTSTCWIELHPDRIENKTYDNETNFSCHAENQFGQLAVHDFIVRRAYVPPHVQFHLTNLHNNIAELSAYISSDKFTLPAIHVLVTVKWMDTGLEYERLTDVGFSGQAAVKLPGIVENSTYVVSMSARNQAGYGPLTSLVIFTDRQVTSTTVQPSKLVSVTSHDQPTQAMNMTHETDATRGNTMILYKLKESGTPIDIETNISSFRTTDNRSTSNKIESFMFYLSFFFYIFCYELIFNA